MFDPETSLIRRAGNITAYCAMHEISAGDFVLAWPRGAAEATFVKTTAVLRDRFKQHRNAVVLVVTGRGPVIVTDDHPIHRRRGGEEAATPAGEIEPGDELPLSSGGWSAVRMVAKTRIDRGCGLLFGKNGPAEIITVGVRVPGG